MSFPLYSNVLILRALPEEGISIDDIGIVVERHDVKELETGYSVEFFDMVGNTVAVITLPMNCFRLPNHSDRPAVRHMANAI